MVCHFLESLFVHLLGFKGTMLEKYLTHPANEFARLLRSTPNVTPEALECFKKPEAYRYSKVCRRDAFNILLTGHRSPETL